MPTHPRSGRDGPDRELGQALPRECLGFSRDLTARGQRVLLRSERELRGLTRAQDRFAHALGEAGLTRDGRQRVGAQP
jgi:hypothetical protein